MKAQDGISLFRKISKTDNKIKMAAINLINNVMNIFLLPFSNLTIPNFNVLIQKEKSIHK